MPPQKKTRTSVFFTAEVLAEIEAEAARLERPLSWVLQQAWRVARQAMKKLPADTDTP